MKDARYFSDKKKYVVAFDEYYKRYFAFRNDRLYLVKKDEIVFDSDDYKECQAKAKELTKEHRTKQIELFSKRNIISQMETK